MMMIMQMDAMLVLPPALSKKKDGTPISAPAPKQRKLSEVTEAKAV